MGIHGKSILQGLSDLKLSLNLWPSWHNMRNSSDIQVGLVYTLDQNNELQATSGIKLKVVLIVGHLLGQKCSWEPACFIEFAISWGFGFEIHDCDDIITDDSDDYGDDGYLPQVSDNRV